MAPRSEQLSYVLNARVGVSGFQSAGGASDTVTNALTAALMNASRTGGAVPLQVGNNTTPGVEVANGLNIVPIYTATGNRMVDGSGADVYGKVSNSGSTWTLTYFSSPGGIEAAFNMPAGSISFEFDYCFQLKDLPRTAMTGVTDRRLNADPALLGTRLFAESLTVTAANTLSSTTYSQTGAVQIMLVNNMAYRGVGSAPPFWIVGKSVTWSQANAGFSLQPGDDVLVVYSY